MFGLGRAAHQLGEDLIRKERRCVLHRFSFIAIDKCSSGRAALAFGGVKVLTGALYRVGLCRS